MKAADARGRNAKKLRKAANIAAFVLFVWGTAPDVGTCGVTSESVLGQTTPLRG